MSENARDQARAQVRSIVAMVNALDVEYDRLEELRDADAEDLAPEEAEELAKLSAAAGDCADEDDAQRAIYEDPLSVEYRSGWSASQTDLTPEEFRIVLCTGGPHVELVGDYDMDDGPSRVRVLFKDWGTSGELFGLDDAERNALERYSAMILGC